MLSQNEQNRREAQRQRQYDELDRAAYSISDTLRLLSLSRTTLYELAKSGQIRIRKVGRKSLVLREDIAGFLDKLSEAA